MSTLKTGTVQNNTGTGAPVFKNSAGTEIGQLAKAWVNFDGSGTVAIRDSFNVSSITDSATGTYVVNISNALSNSNYAVTANSLHLQGVYLAFPTLRDRDQQTRSTTQFQIDCLNNSATTVDGQELHIAIFGA